MDELLQRALVRREELRKELQAVDSFIQSYSAVTETRRVPEMDDLFTRSKRQAYSKRQRAKANEAAMDAAESIIVAAGRPLSRSELLRELERQGHEIVGSDKSKVLGTNIWRSGRFHNLKGAGYWPISAPIPDQFKGLEQRDSMLLDGGQK